MSPALARILLVAVSITAATSPAAAKDLIPLRAKDERLAEIERAIRPARLFEIRSGPVLCGEILRIDRREPYRESTLLLRARWRKDVGSPWLFADEPLELRFADLVYVTLEFENTIDFRLLLSSRDEASPPLGGASWSLAMDWALDGEGILGLARGQAPEPFEGSEPGWLAEHLTGPDPSAPLSAEANQAQMRMFAERPIRANASSLGESTIAQLLEGLAAAEERGAELEPLWAQSRGAANYLFSLRRVLRRGDASLAPTTQADLDAQRIELYSLRSLRDLATVLEGARSIQPRREDAADRDALLAAIAAHQNQAEDGRDALGSWTRALDAPSSTLWPDALLASPDPSRRVAWALRLVRECPSLWAVEDDLADLRDPSLDTWIRGFVRALLSAGSRRLSSTGASLPNPRLRDALGLGARAREVEFLQPEGVRTPLQIDAQRTLAAYLQAERPVEEFGPAFADEAFARRRQFALGLFAEAFGAFDAGRREAALYTLLEAGPERIIVTPDTLRLAALNIEHYLGLHPAPDTREARRLEDSVLELCLLAGLYGAGDGRQVGRFREALGGAVEIVATTTAGIDLMRNLGLEPPPRVPGQPEVFADALRGRLPVFCAAMQSYLLDQDPEEALVGLRDFVHLALNVEEDR